MACWVSARHGQEEVPVPVGQFESIKSVDPIFCGLRADQTVACWEWESDWSQRDEDGNPGLVLVEANLPDWRFTDITLATLDGRVGGQTYACGLQGDLIVACWAWQTKYDPEYDDYRAFAFELELLDGQFTDIRGNWGSYVCGLRVDQTIACWRWLYQRDGDGYAIGVLELVESDAPAGRFTAIRGQWGNPAGAHVCGLRVDQTIACWDSKFQSDGDGNRVWELVESDAPAGRFTGIEGLTSPTRSEFFLCGFRADLIVACWHWSYGDLDLVERSLPDGQFTHVRHVADESWCGLHADSITVCWSWSWVEVQNGCCDYRHVLEGADLPSGQFTDVFRTSIHSFWCGLRDNQTVVCWPESNVPDGWMDERLSDGQIIAIEFRSIGEGLEDWCALRDDDELICVSAQAPGNYG